MIKHYVTSEEKYKDNKDTAVSLLILGALGIIVLIFVYIKFFSDSTPGFSTFFRLGIFLALFIGFIIGGIVSLSASRKYKTNITTDNNERNDIQSFLLNTADLKENINSKISEDSLTDEELYIARNNILLELLKEKFENSSETLLEEMIENNYDKIF